jgi:hypothetical protein
VVFYVRIVFLVIPVPQIVDSLEGKDLLSLL